MSMLQPERQFASWNTRSQGGQAAIPRQPLDFVRRIVYLQTKLGTSQLDQQTMPFEFIGRALRGATEILGSLLDEVGNGRANREEDVRKVKRAFGALGRMEEPEDEPNGFIDRPLDTAIRGFQRDKGLRVDGFMRPDGPTQRSLQNDVLGFLNRDNDGLGRDPDNGLDRFRARSLSPGASLLDERDSAPRPFDLDRDGSDRGSFALLDLGERAASASRPRGFRPGWDDTESDTRPSRQSRDRLTSRTGESRPDGGGPAVGMQPLAAKTAARAAPEEFEPARLKPALDKIERNLRRTVEGWREQGMTDAARHLEHFLEGSGAPITYKP